MKKIIVFLAITVLFSCNNSAQNINKKQQTVIDADPVVVPLTDGKARTRLVIQEELAMQKL